MADVFVSYARSDKARVAPLVGAIEAQGWSVWWDPEISPARNSTARSTLNCRRPPSSSSSGPRLGGVTWVRGEAREAADRGILVPVRFEGARLPIDVRAIHTTDLDGWRGDTQSRPFRICCAHSAP